MENTKIVFNASSIGQTHIKTNKECEDWSGSYKSDKMSICVVADGHGSDNYPRTDRGSKFAVQVMMNCTKEFIDNIDVESLLHDKNNQALEQLAKSVLSSWHTLVEDDSNNEPFSDEELEKVSEKYSKYYRNGERRERAYGTTLIMFAITKEYCFGLQIGDGKCIALDDKGNCFQPIPWDKNCQLNITTSICDSDAIEEFRYYISSEIPIAVFCGTDGIDDSYTSDEEIYALYRSILSIFLEYGEKVGNDEVNDYLPVLTKKGSGDDVSISGIIDKTNSKELLKILNLRSELFKVEEEIKNKEHQRVVSEEKMQPFLKKQKIITNINNIDGYDEDFVTSLRSKQKEYDELKTLIAKLKQKRETIIDNIHNFRSSSDVIIEQINNEILQDQAEINEEKVDSAVTVESIPEENSCLEGNNNKNA